MNIDAHYSHCEELVKRHDPERYLVTLLFPDEDRRSLMPLFAFNHEIASVAEAVSEPMIGLIRLTWWKEAVDEIYEGKKVREHPVLLALKDVIESSNLPRGWHYPMIEARGRDVNKEAPESLQDFYDYCHATSTVLLGAAAHIMGAVGHEHHEAISAIGRAWAVSGLLRAVPHFATSGRCILPKDILAKYGASTEDVIAGKNQNEIQQAIEDLAAIELSQMAVKKERVQSSKTHRFYLYNVHSKWWLQRIVKLRGNVFDGSVNNGKFVLLLKLWFNF